MNIIYIWLQTDGYLRVDTIVNQTIPYHIPIVQLYYLFNTLIKTWDLMDRQWHPRVTIVIHQKYHIIIRHRQKLTQCKTTHWKYSHAPWVIVNIGKTVNSTHISPVLTDYYCCEGAQGVATDVWPFVKEVGHGGRRLWARPRQQGTSQGGLSLGRLLIASDQLTHNTNMGPRASLNSYPTTRECIYGIDQ